MIVIFLKVIDRSVLYSYKKKITGKRNKCTNGHLA